MSEEKKHIVYSAADIKRYLSGAMSPVEMHAIEMAALDDPFLAEAMEGYEMLEEKDYSKELLLLKKEFSNPPQKTESPVIPVRKAPVYKWWRAAAAVLIIGIAAGTAYLFTTTGKQDLERQKTAKLLDAITVDSAPAIAKVDSVPVIEDKNTAGFSSSGAVGLSADQANNGTISTLIKDSLQYASADRRSRADSDFVYTPSAPVYAYTPTTKDDAANYFSRQEDKKTKELSETVTAGNAISSTLNATEINIDNLKQESLKYKNNQAGNGLTNNFYAQVVTPDNKPVSFANVKVAQNRKPVSTDANGVFQWKSNDTSIKVTVSSAGYAPQKFTLQNSVPQNTIVLQPQEVATEKVVAAANVKRLAKARQVVSDSTGEDDEEEDEYAEPTGGWVEYNNYLNNNLVMPGEAITKNIHGEVEVFVKLKSNGEIRQAKVAKTLCAQCDAEALRLVKEGPKFELKNNKVKKVKVTVKF